VAGDLTATLFHGRRLRLLPAAGAERLAALSLRKSRGHGRRAAALSAGTSPAL